MNGPLLEPRVSERMKSITIMLNPTLNANSGRRTTISHLIIDKLNSTGCVFKEHDLKMIIFSGCQIMAAVILNGKRSIGCHTCRLVVDSLRCILIKV